MLKWIKENKIKTALIILISLFVLPIINNIAYWLTDFPENILKFKFVTISFEKPIEIKDIIYNWATIIFSCAILITSVESNNLSKAIKEREDRREEEKEREKALIIYYELLEGLETIRNKHLRKEYDLSVVSENIQSGYKNNIAAINSKLSIKERHLVYGLYLDLLKVKNDNYDKLCKKIFQKELMEISLYAELSEDVLDLLDIKYYLLLHKIYMIANGEIKKKDNSITYSGEGEIKYNSRREIDGDNIKIYDTEGNYIRIKGNFKNGEFQDGKSIAKIEEEDLFEFVYKDGELKNRKIYKIGKNKTIKEKQLEELKKEYVMEAKKWDECVVRRIIREDIFVDEKDDYIEKFRPINPSYRGYNIDEIENKDNKIKTVIDDTVPSIEIKEENMLKRYGKEYKEFKEGKLQRIEKYSNSCCLKKEFIDGEKLKKYKNEKLVYEGEYIVNSKKETFEEHGHGAFKGNLNDYDSKYEGDFKNGNFDNGELTCLNQKIKEIYKGKFKDGNFEEGEFYKKGSNDEDEEIKILEVKCKDEKYIEIIKHRLDFKKYDLKFNLKFCELGLNRYLPINIDYVIIEKLVNHICKSRNEKVEKMASLLLNKKEEDHYIMKGEDKIFKDMQFVGTIENMTTAENMMKDKDIKIEGQILMQEDEEVTLFNGVIEYNDSNELLVKGKIFDIEGNEIFDGEI